MNRKLLVVPVIGAVLLLCSNAFSNSVDYCTDQSAAFIANHTRQASTDAADIVAYNPAGEALMAPGLYVSVNQQSLFMDYKEEFSNPYFSEKYKDDKTIWLYPNVYGVYNMGKVGEGNLAFGLKAGIIAGGGGLEWDGNTALAAAGLSIFSKLPALVQGALGAPTGTDFTQKVSSAYYGFGGNAAYSFLDNKVSISVGGQYIYSEKTAETSGNWLFAGGAISWDSKFDYEADGYNLIFGIDIRPVEKLTIGMRYETEAELSYRFHEDKNEVSVLGTPSSTVAAELSVSGKTEQYNLPATFACGAEYRFTPDFSLAIGGDLFFFKNADMSGYEKELGEYGYELNMGMTYALIPSFIKLSAGVTYAEVTNSDKIFSSTDELTTQGPTGITNKILMGGIGVTCTAAKDLDIILSSSYLTTIDGKEKGTTSAGEVSYYRDVLLVAIGVNYKVF